MTIAPPPAITFRVPTLFGGIREELLKLHVIKIGRVPSAHLRIDVEGVSRMHAVIEAQGNDVAIIDLGSVHGTYVNGAKINKARLKTGDTITFGAVIVEILIEAVAVGATVPVGDLGPLQPHPMAPLHFPEPKHRALISCQIRSGPGGSWESRTYDIKRGSIPEQGWLIDFGNGWVGGGMRTTWTDVLDWLQSLAARDVELIDVSEEAA